MCGPFLSNPAILAELPRFIEKFSHRLIFEQLLWPIVCIMGDLRKVIGCAMALWLAMAAAGSAAAVTLDLPGRAQVFADCAGRYSAQMEHEWLFGRDGRAARQQRGRFVDLLDALADAGLGAGPTPADMLNWRIQSKHAQARLLRMAAFHTDPARAARAAGASRRALRACDLLILG